MADKGKSYQIFRYEKVKTAGAIRWREIEQNRTQADKDREFNGDIDFERTQNNVYLVRGRDFLKEIEKALKEHGIEKHRKDAILMLDGVVTLSPEKAKEMSKEELEQYFKDALAFVGKYQGTVINAVIHYDETTPHMHYDVVPLVQKADETWKLSAKDVVGNSSKMSRMQTIFNDEVGFKYGLERGERKAPNKENRKHKSKLQHDIEVQQATITEQGKIIKEHNNTIAECEMIEQAYTANIQNQETIMQDNDVTIQNQNKAITNRKAEIEAKDELIEVKNKIINQYDILNQRFNLLKEGQEDAKSDIAKAKELISKKQYATAELYLKDAEETITAIDKGMKPFKRLPFEEAPPTGNSGDNENDDYDSYE